MGAAIRLIVLGIAMIVSGSGCQESTAPAVSPTTPKSPGGAVRGKSSPSDTPAVVSEADARAAQEIVERAIQAHVGSAERLAKLRVYQSLSKGTMYAPIGELGAVREVQALWPDTVRVTFLLTMPDGNKRVSLVLTSERGWRQTGDDPPSDLDQEDLSEIRPDVYAIWMSTLIPLQDKTATVAPLGEAEVTGQRCVGIKASRRGWPDVSLYFDAQTGLLSKLGYKGREAGVAAYKETYFSDYKDFDGLKLAAKQVQFYDRRKASDWAAIDYHFPERIDRAIFEKP
jgi:hypothetical protein